MYDFDKIVNRERSFSYKYDLRKQFADPDEIIPMWVADMDFEVPPIVYEEMKKRLDHKIYGYTIQSDDFYKSVMYWFNKRHNWQIEKEWISYAPGVVPSLAIAIHALTNPGDEIIIQTPVYHPFAHVIKSNKRKMVNNRLKLSGDRYYIDFDDLRKKMAPNVKLMILCSPHNPVGRVWTTDELGELANICLENNVIIISDEIHADIVYPPHRHVPLANLNNDIANNSITTIAPSKTFNIAGLATSAVIVPNKKLLNKYLNVQNSWHVGMGNVFGYTALEAAYYNGEEWLDELLKYLADNIKYVSDYLKSEIPQIKLIPVESTYLLWLDCREMGLNNNELRDFFIKKAKVWFNDGPSFGPGGEGFQRMNIGCPRAIIEKALKRIRRALNSEQEI